MGRDDDDEDDENLSSQQQQQTTTSEKTILGPRTFIVYNIKIDQSHRVIHLGEEEDEEKKKRLMKSDLNFFVVAVVVVAVEGIYLFILFTYSILFTP